ncbi:hypothetical protein RUND412_002641 [Rhizina undulata]
MAKQQKEISNTFTNDLIHFYTDLSSGRILDSEGTNIVANIIRCTIISNDRPTSRKVGVQPFGRYISLIPPRPRLSGYDPHQLSCAYYSYGELYLPVIKLVEQDRAGGINPGKAKV